MQNLTNICQERIFFPKNIFMDFYRNSSSDLIGDLLRMAFGIYRMIPPNNPYIVQQKLPQVSPRKFLPEI